MTGNTVNVLMILCAGNIAIKLAWKILNVFAMYQVGLGWVLCPFPCDVFAVYLPGTPPLAPSVPNTARLTEPIESLAKLPYPVFLPFCNKTLQLMHVNGLLKFAIEECWFDINLMDLKVVCGSKREEKTNGISLSNHWGQGLVYWVSKLWVNSKEMEKELAINSSSKYQANL